MGWLIVSSTFIWNKFWIFWNSPAILAMRVRTKLIHKLKFSSLCIFFKIDIYGHTRKSAIRLFSEKQKPSYISSQDSIGVVHKIEAIFTNRDKKQLWMVRFSIEWCDAMRLKLGFSPRDALTEHSLFQKGSVSICLSCHAT